MGRCPLSLEDDSIGLNTGELVVRILDFKETSEPGWFDRSRVLSHASPASFLSLLFATAQSDFVRFPGVPDRS